MYGVQLSQRPTYVYTPITSRGVCLLRSRRRRRRRTHKSLRYCLFLRFSQSRPLTKLMLKRSRYTVLNRNRGFFVPFPQIQTGRMWKQLSGILFFRWPGNKKMGPCTGTSFIILSSNKSYVLFRFLFTHALNARPYDATTTSCCTSFRAKEEGNGRNVFTVRSLLRGTKGDVPPTFYTAFFQEGRGALLLIASERISMEIQGGGGEGRKEDEEVTRWARDSTIQTLLNIQILMFCSFFFMGTECV